MPSTIRFTMVRTLGNRRSGHAGCARADGRDARRRATPLTPAAPPSARRRSARARAPRRRPARAAAPRQPPAPCRSPAAPTSAGPPGTPRTRACGTAARGTRRRPPSARPTTRAAPAAAAPAPPPAARGTRPARSTPCSAATVTGIVCEAVAASADRRRPSWRRYSTHERAAAVALRSAARRTGRRRRCTSCERPLDELSRLCEVDAERARRDQHRRDRHRHDRRRRQQHAPRAPAQHRQRREPDQQRAQRRLRQRQHEPRPTARRAPPRRSTRVRERAACSIVAATASIATTRKRP